MKSVIVTCPPMLGQIKSLMEYARERGIELHAAKTTQTLSEETPTNTNLHNDDEIWAKIKIVLQTASQNYNKKF